MEMLAAYEKSLDNSGRILRGIRMHHLSRPTACEGWDVHTVLAHLIGTTLMYGAGGLAPNETLEPADIGSDPGWTYALAAKTALDTFGADGAIDRTFRLPVGEVPGRIALGLAATEAAVHAWDIATASGKSGTIEAEVAESLLAFHTEHGAPEWRQGPDAIFGPEVLQPSAAHPSDRLVAFLGRQPR
jgi:uncharacterized protein (TIGR03086 family)